jgi:hypothetical protein
MLFRKWNNGDMNTANYTLYYFGTTSGLEGQVVFYGNKGGVWDSLSENSPTVLPLNVWTHLALSFSSSGGGQLYVNGSPVGGVVSGGTLMTNSSSLDIGSAPNPFPGAIDEVRVYNRALSAKEVSDLYNLGK